jgi:hypothetical protein
MSASTHRYHSAMPPLKSVVRKVIYLHPDENEAVRRRAYEERISQAAVIRQAIRRHLGLEA